MVAASSLLAAGALAQGAPPDPPADPAAPPPAAEAAPATPPPPPPPASQPPPGNYQQPPPGNYQQPGVYEPPPPPPAGADPSVHFHDGFYFRGSIGGGALGATISVDGLSDDIEVSGGAFSLDLMFGGTPADGLVIGGAYFFSQAQKPNVKVGSQEGESKNNFNFGIIGPFVDWFFVPDGGFHAGLIVGGAVANVTNNDGTEKSSSATGAGGGIFLGYDFWIGEQWSLGILGRATGGSVTNTDALIDEKITVANFALLGTVLYH